jgi:hypothetical protein
MLLWRSRGLCPGRQSATAELWASARLLPISKCLSFHLLNPHAGGYLSAEEKRHAEECIPFSTSLPVMLLRKREQIWPGSHLCTAAEETIRWLGRWASDRLLKCFHAYRRRRALLPVVRLVGRTRCGLGRPGALPTILNFQSRAKFVFSSYVPPFASAGCSIQT